jgi:hypothetical protein
VGKYTDLTRKIPEKPQVRKALVYNNNVNINNIYNNKDSVIDKLTSAQPKDLLQGSAPVEMQQSVASGGEAEAGVAEKRVTNLRTTNLTNLFGSEDEEVWVATLPRSRYTSLYCKAEASPVRCIHGATRDACAVCSGYARWLIADEVRLRKAQANPEAVRREFWRSESGRERRERFFT